MSKYKLGDKVLTREDAPYEEIHGVGTVTSVPTKDVPYYGVDVKGKRKSDTDDFDWLFAESELEPAPHSGGGVGPGAPGGDVRALLEARYSKWSKK